MVKGQGRKLLPSLSRPTFTPLEGVHPDTGFKELLHANEVDPDEQIYWLWELELTAPDYQSRRRYQVIIVVRIDDGKAVKAQYVQDMGPVQFYPVDQLDLPGHWALTVAEAQDAANEFRMKNLRYEMGIPEPVSLEANYHDELDILKLQKNRISQFGRLHKVERGL